MDELLVANLLDLSKTVAARLFDTCKYPWEALPELTRFIAALKDCLPADEYRFLPGNVCIHKTAVIAPSAFIGSNTIVCEGAEIRHCAFIRGSAIVGKGSVVGNSTEIKNAILFDQVQAPHFNYVGDTILGFKSHIGAGVINSNMKSDKTNVIVKFPGGEIPTGLRKFGAVIGDHAEVGCNSVLNPGTVIGRETVVYPLSSVRGFIPERSIYKKRGDVVARQMQL